MRRRGSTFANPVLVGAVTILAVIVAVFLSYNANKGLPFVSTYSVTVRLPDASELVEGNDVRVGGSRVGLISKLAPHREGKRVVAYATVKLEQSVAPLPADSRAVVRQRSALGLKYLEIDPGTSKTDLPEGAVLRNDQAQTPAVDFDDVLSSFDAKTRSSFANVIGVFGTGLAGRADSLNQAVNTLPTALRGLEDVTRNLADPATRLGAFIAATGDAARGVEPVAPEFGAFFDAAARTFDALNDPAALQSTLTTAAATLRPDAADLRATIPDIRDARQLLVALRPGLDQLPPAASQFSQALARVSPPLAAAAPTFRATAPLVSDLRDLARAPITSKTLVTLKGLTDRMTPLLRYVTPEQTVCNYFGLWFRNVPSLLSEGDQLGTWFRAQVVSQTDETFSRDSPAPNAHYNPYPYTGQNGQCEAGNQPYVGDQVIGHNPVAAPGSTESTGPPVGNLKDLG